MKLVALFPVEVGHPYHQLLSPRLSDLSPASHNPDSPPAAGIPPIALAPPAAAFMASPSILGAFQPYSPLLPMMADSKTSKKFKYTFNLQSDISKPATLGPDRSRAIEFSETPVVNVYGTKNLHRLP